jgi:predicted ferric reductase
MSELAIGTDIFLGGSFGSFTHGFAEETSPVVFVAGGIGITPFMAHLFRADAPRSWLVYANRNEASSLFIGQLRKQLSSRLVEVYSDDPRRPKQYVSPETFENIGVDPRSCVYYLCGPLGMIEHARETLVSMDVPARQIHSEKFMF